MKNLPFSPILAFASVMESISYVDSVARLGNKSTPPQPMLLVDLLLSCFLFSPLVFSSPHEHTTPKTGLLQTLLVGELAVLAPFRSHSRNLMNAGMVRADGRLCSNRSLLY